MTGVPRGYVSAVLIAGVLVFGLPFTGLVNQRVFGGMQLGVVLAWAATLVIPVVIALHEFGELGEVS